MKRALTVILLSCVALATFAQEEQSQETFKSVNNELIWQEIFPIDTTAEEMYSYLSSTCKVEYMRIKINTIYGYFYPIFLDYKFLGYTEFSVPRLIKFFFNGNFKIEFENDRYRVTVYNMYVSSPSKYIADKQELFVHMDSYAKNGRVRLNKAIRHILDANFHRIFKLNSLNSTSTYYNDADLENCNDDW